MTAMLDPLGDDDAAAAGVWAVPYRAVPPLTNRGVTHEIVAVDGFYSSYSNYLAGYALVYGQTRCGVKRLLVDRSASGFPDCRRCYPATR